MSPNCVLIDTIEIDMLHDFGCYGNRFVGNCEILSYQNVSLYKLGWHSDNSLARVLNCISLERAGHQHCNKVCRICIEIFTNFKVRSLLSLELNLLFAKILK